MPQIGIKRFAARHRQHNRTKNRCGDTGMIDNKAHAQTRVKSHQHTEVFNQCNQAKQADNHKPQNHHGAEQTADGIGAVTLNRKQTKNQKHRGRDDIGFENGGCNLQPFHRAEHGNGGSDHAVAIKQRGPDQTRT